MERMNQSEPTKVVCLVFERDDELLLEQRLSEGGQDAAFHETIEPGKEPS